jgi:D-cysteine desulfhydrase
VHLVLYDQPTSPTVVRNVGGFLAANAQLHVAGSIPRAFVTCGDLHRRLAKEGRKPYFIMVGGTSRLGCIGHVSAALELARQIAGGAIPEPEILFVPLGTCGTAAGLIAGLKIAGLRTRVAAVRVADPFPANRPVLRYLAQDVATFLNRADPAVPRVRIRPDDFDVVTTHFGEGYGVPTTAGEQAVRWAEPRLSLDTTYSGKALAACLEHMQIVGRNTTALFWNTYNSASVEAPTDWDRLPPELRPVLNL